MNFRNDLMNQEGSNTDNGNPSQVAPKDKGSESNHSDTNDAYQLLKMSAQQQENLPTASEKTTTQEEEETESPQPAGFHGSWTSDSNYGCEQ